MSFINKFLKSIRIIAALADASATPITFAGVCQGLYEPFRDCDGHTVGSQGRLLCFAVSLSLLTLAAEFAVNMFRASTSTRSARCAVALALLEQAS